MILLHHIMTALPAVVLDFQSANLRAALIHETPLLDENIYRT